MPPSNQEIHALHRYFIWSLNMRDHFYSAVQSQGEPSTDGQKPLKWLIKPFMYVTLWFGLLYVVVEGFQQLGLSDTDVEPFLRSPNIAVLRRLRNGAFHYQREYFDARFRDFLNDSTIEWAEELQASLGRFFLKWTDSHGIELKATDE